MQVGESQCTDPKILQAVADTLKEALGKEIFPLFLDCDVARYAWWTFNAFNIPQMSCIFADEMDVRVYKLFGVLLAHFFPD